MFQTLAKRFFGSANERFIKTLQADIDAINALEADYQALSDTALQAKTAEFQDRLQRGETLDGLLHEAFATVRETAWRTIGQRHYDVQLMGGIVLHRGMIAEMKTGEGKTLVATLAVYLNALARKGVHVVTVNDYLARRDCEWMGKIYTFLGLSVGKIISAMDDTERQQAYLADVTYGTNNEFGFDYLRDNMKFALEEMVQRPFNFAIVDETDSILIDEARTPLVISGKTEGDISLYSTVDSLIPRLKPAEDYEVDEKARSVTLTDEGTKHVETLLTEAGLLNTGDTLYDVHNVSLVHHVNQALRAHTLFEKDRDYIVKDDKVVIIDEFTGRMMEGRRYSDGLHQALEARESVSIQQENQTLASVTFQNYFRLYPKLAGMTGTAMTEAGEFAEIYHLDVIEMPTHMACVRDDRDDEVYRTAAEKYAAIVEEITQAHTRAQPVLVGTVSIEKSEHLSHLLKQAKIPHNVLNARYHEQEASIIAHAGKPKAVTIATNMAGRGTDIQLGGNLELALEEAPAGTHAEVTQRIDSQKQAVIAAGGLYVIGTERHESRRIDNQLRGRAGRQGDAGISQFYLSLEDDLMRIFGSERLDGMLQKLGIQEGEAIVHPWVNKAIEKAQQKVESRNFEIRKTLLKFDDVMNDQRKVVFEQRKELMAESDVSDTVTDMRHQTIEDLVTRAIPEKAYAEQWDIDFLHTEIMRIFALDVPLHDWAKEEGIAEQEVLDRLIRMTDHKMAEKAVRFGADTMRSVEKSLLLQVFDHMWKDHLLTLDHLRQGIGLRSYAQRDPLREYQAEAFNLFNVMLESLRERVTIILAHIEIEGRLPQTPPQTPTFEGRSSPISSNPSGPLSTPVVTRKTVTERDPADPSTWGRVSRNAPCPCGSGRKYKHCHGKL